MSSTAKTANAIEIFYSYSHKDQRFRDELETHLSLLKREGNVSSWHDRKIGAGEEWAGKIDTHLNAAQIILLFISPDFIDSDYCYSVEMVTALERHNAGVARVIPIILRPVDWKSSPFGKLQALPTDGKPITSRSWHTRDEAYLNVVQGIRKIVVEIIKNSNQKSDNKLSGIGLTQTKSISKEPPLSSNVILIDAFLDPHDSPYEQYLEDGKKKIRYKEQKSG